MTSSNVNSLSLLSLNEITSTTKTPPKQLPKSESGAEDDYAEPDFLVIGRIVKPHGLKGEVSVKVLTDFTERFDIMETVYLGDDQLLTEYKIKATRWHKERVLITFEDIFNRDKAEGLRGLFLKIPLEEAMPLDSDTYYHYQLRGLKVFTDTNDYLGLIIDVLETGANDVYIVKGPQGEVLLPAIKEVILDVNLETKQMQVHLLEGLI